MIEPLESFSENVLAFEHLSRWERVAVVTDVEWIKQAMRLSVSLFRRYEIVPIIGG